MTHPGPPTPPDPGATPQGPGWHSPQPANYPPPQAGASPSPGAYPGPDAGGFPPPQAGSYPPPQAGAYPPPQGGGFPPGVPYPGTPQPESKAKKWAGLAGGVVVAGVVAASWFGFGGGQPEVGDCVAPSGDDAFEVVDCGSDEAQGRVVGVQDGKQTEDEFMADPNSCSEFPAAEMALWVSDSVGTDGTVLCAESV